MVLTEKQKEKQRIAVRKYRNSNKGRMNREIYLESEQGKASQEKHWRSEKNKLAKKNYAQTIKGKLVQKNSYKKHCSKYWYKSIVITSKKKDISLNRCWNEEDYITPEFVLFLNEQQESKCIYCKVTMKYGEGQPRNISNGLTIQRMNCDLAHIKSNCVLSCMKCNVTFKSKPHQEILDFLNS